MKEPKILGLNNKAKLTLKIVFLVKESNISCYCHYLDVKQKNRGYTE